ncbi:MFS_ShiA_like domain containing protein [Comamonadaceae bacterium]
MSHSRNIIMDSTVGTVFEWYDFFVLGTMASILGTLFIPEFLGKTGYFSQVLQLMVLAWW